MPHHVHTPPQCGYWTGHDPACFNQEFGAEVDCILIELGKNKGNYLCVHKRAPFTEASAERAEFPSVREHVLLEFRGTKDPELAKEYGQIHHILTEGAKRLTGPESAHD